MYKLMLLIIFLFLSVVASYSQSDSVKIFPSFTDPVERSIPKSEWGSLGNTLVYSNGKFYTLDEINIDTGMLSGTKIESMIIEKDEDKIRSFLNDKIIAIIFINDSTKIKELNKEK